MQLCLICECATCIAVLVDGLGEGGGGKGGVGQGRAAYLSNEVVMRPVPEAHSTVFAHAQTN